MCLKSAGCQCMLHHVSHHHILYCVSFLLRCYYPVTCRFIQFIDWAALRYCLRIPHCNTVILQLYRPLVTKCFIISKPYSIYMHGKLSWLEFHMKSDSLEIHVDFPEICFSHEFTWNFSPEFQVFTEITWKRFIYIKIFMEISDNVYGFNIFCHETRVGIWNSHEFFVKKCVMLMTGILRQICFKELRCVFAWQQTQLFSAASIHVVNI